MDVVVDETEVVRNDYTRRQRRVDSSKAKADGARCRTLDSTDSASIDFNGEGEVETLTDFIDSDNETDPLPCLARPHFLETVSFAQSNLEWDDDRTQLTLLGDSLALQDQIERAQNISEQLQETLADLNNDSIFESSPIDFSTPIPVTQVKVTTQPSLRRSERVPKKPDFLNL